MKLLFLLNTAIRSSSLLFGFIISVVLSNLYGVEVLGLYTLFITLLNLLLIFVRGGQDRQLIKELNDGQFNQNQVISESLLLIIALGVLTAILSYLLLSYEVIKIPQSITLNRFFLVLSMALFAGGIISLSVVVLRARNYVTLANCAEGLPVNVALLVTLCAAYYIGWHELGGKLVLTSYAIICTAVAILLIVFLRYKVAWQFQITQISLYRRFRMGLPFMLIFGATSLNTSIDTIMVNHFLSIKDVAYYNVALKLSSLVQFGLVISTSLIMSKMAKLYQLKQIAELRSLIRKSTLLALSLALPIALIFLVFPLFALGLWGPEFWVSKNALFVLILAQLVNVSFGPLGVMLTIVGKEKLVLYWSAVILIGNTIGNWLLIPMFGIEGAAISTAFFVIAENVLFYSIVRVTGLLKQPMFSSNIEKLN